MPCTVRGTPCTIRLILYMSTVYCVQAARTPMKKKVKPVRLLAERSTPEPLNLFELFHTRHREAGSLEKASSSTTEAPGCADAVQPFGTPIPREWFWFVCSTAQCTLVLGYASTILPLPTQQDRGWPLGFEFLRVLRGFPPPALQH